MKIERNAFTSDMIGLSIWELIKIAFGGSVTACGIIVFRS